MRAHTQTHQINPRAPQRRVHSRLIAQSASRLVVVISALTMTFTGALIGCDETGSKPESPNPISPNTPVDDAPNQSVSKPVFIDGNQDVSLGQDEFISASGERGDQANMEDDLAAGSPEASASDSDERSVEEGDIYRVVREGLMANLNHYRGLQLIDISDTSAPSLLGRLSLSGSPVEMYFVDGFAVVLMNHWWGYWGGRDDIEAESFNGGLVALIDIRDPSAPRLANIQPVPGYIRTSRLTRGMGGDALFVVANDWSQSENRVILRSFSVNTGASAESAELTPAGELDLGGYIADIQATPSTLLIARSQGWSRRGESWRGTYVSLVDISDPSGQLIEGGSVQVEGYVRRKTDMNIHNGVLRVVSADWSTGSVVATWNIDDIQNPVAIDQARFGENEDLYASLFMRDRAFFVTYRRVDPFHAFSIDSEGLIEERTEYIISGWNDFFRPTFNQQRLIGIGVDDQAESQSGGASNSIAVSLYTTDLEVEEPFIARAHGDLRGWSWSEARWDDRAFSVIEDAVSVMSPEGVEETGLVLLPFSGYDDSGDGWRGWRSGVQLFTFSDQSVTARGVMSHNSPVRRSFEPEAGTVGNLSELSLSLYDRANPDEPSLLGTLDLAPEISRVYFIGEGPARHAVRLRGSNDLFYGYYYYDERPLSPASLEVLEVGADVDLANPIATIEIPARASVRLIGDVFHVIHDYSTYTDVEGQQREWTRHVDLKLIDMADPSAPEARGELDITELFEGYDSYYHYNYDYWGCFDIGPYWWGRPTLEVHEVEGGIAIKSLEAQRLSLGEYQVCHIGHDTYGYDGLLTGRAITCDDIYEAPLEGECEVIRGYSSCERPIDGEFSCQGELEVCVLRFDRLTERYTYEDCEPVSDEQRVALAEIASQRREGYDCYEYERERYWGSMHLNIIDTSDLDAPQVAGEVIAEDHERFEGLIAQEGSLYYSYSVPVNVEGDAISYVRHFTREISVDSTDAPELGTPVNLPGKLLLKRGDLMITRDLVWGPNTTLDALNIAELNDEGTRATLRARHLFNRRLIQNLYLDELASGEERLVVSDRFNYDMIRYDEHYEWSDEEYWSHVTIFDLTTLSELGESASDQWSTLVGVRAGKGIFQVGGGVLLMDLSDPNDITPQGFFPLKGWSPSLTIEGDSIYAAAGRYGVYTLPLEEDNLLPPL